MTMGPGTFAETPAPLEEIRTGDRTFWSLAALAFLVRVVVLSINLSHAQPVIRVADSLSYLRCAESLVVHGGIVGDDGQPVLGRTPGYPAFLALTFLTHLSTPDRLTGALVLQALVSAMTVALAARMASLVAGRTTGLLAGGILAVEPSCISFSNLILTETLYTCALVAAVLAAWRWLTRPGPGTLAWFAGLVALVPVIRPVGLYLPWLLGPIVAWRAPRSRRIPSAVLFLAMALLPSAAWSARNRLHFGTAVFDPTGPYGKALFGRQVEVRATGVDDPIGSETVPLSSHRWERFYAERGPLPVAQAIEQQDEYFRAMLKAHPVEALEEWLYVGASIFGLPNTELESQLTGEQVTFEGGSLGSRLKWMAGTGLLLPFILLGMVLSLGGIAFMPVFAWRARTWTDPRRSFAILIVTVVVYHVVVSSFVRWQADRYRVPVLPFLAIVLLVGAFGVVRGVRGPRAPSRANAQPQAGTLR